MKVSLWHSIKGGHCVLSFFSFYRNSDLSEQFKKLFNLSLCGQLAEFSYPVKLRESKDVLNPIKQQVNPACVVLSLSNINQSKKKKTHHDHELYNGPLEKYTSTGTKATLNVDNIIKLIKTFWKKKNNWNLSIPLVNV